MFRSAFAFLFLLAAAVTAQLSPAAAQQLAVSRVVDDGFPSDAKNDTHSQEQTTADQIAFANVP